MLPTQRSALLAGALLALAGEASAQVIPSPYAYIEQGQEGGVFAGARNPGRGRFGFGPGPGVVYGVRYGVELAGPLALEGVVSLFPTTRNVIDPDREDGQRVIEEAEVALASIEARMRFDLTGRRTWHALQPYVVIGGGFAWDAQGTQAEDNFLQQRDRFDFGTKFVGSFGSGVRWLPGNRWVLRAEASVALWKLNVPGGFRDPARGFESVSNGEWSNGAGLTLGLAYRW